MDSCVDITLQTQLTPNDRGATFATKINQQTELLPFHIFVPFRTNFFSSVFEELSSALDVGYGHNLLKYTGFNFADFCKSLVAYFRR